jgi:DNA-binding phage protein
MKIVTVSVELAFENFDDEIDFNDKESIAEYLNNALYESPEFFCDFGPENITDVKDIDD